MTLLIYIKRMLKNPGIVVLLLILPVLAYIFKDFAGKTDGAEVGIYTASSAPEITEYLMQNSDAFRFRIYDSAEEMKKDVETQLIECGFILPDNISDMENIKIVCGEGYASVLSEVTKEAVFAAVLKVYGDRAALNFAKKSNIDITDADFDQSYQKYISQTMSSVDFEEIPYENEDKPQKRNIMQSIISAVLICAVLMGSSFFIKDRKKGVYFGAGRCAAAVLILFILSSAAALAIYGTKTDITRFVLLAAGTWGAGCIFSKVVKDERIPWLVMPVLLTVVFLFDIVCIADMIPSLDIVNYFLLTHYYVYAPSGRLALFAAVLFICGIVSDKLIKC